MIKKNSKQAKLIVKALNNYVYFLQEQTSHRIDQLNDSGKFIDIEEVAQEHNETLVDVELLKKTLVDEPEELELDKLAGNSQRKGDIFGGQLPNRRF